MKQIYFKQKNKSTPEKLLNETEISNLPDKEFKVMVIKMFTGLKRRMAELRENFNKKMLNTKRTS